MALPGLPFLVSRPRLCEFFGISRWTLKERVLDGTYNRLEWIKDGSTMKVTRPSMEDQIKAMKITKTTLEAGQ